MKWAAKSKSYLNPKMMFENWFMSMLIRVTVSIKNIILAISIINNKSILRWIHCLILLFIFSRIFHIDYYISNVASWVFAVAFSFFANKIFVYKNSSSVIVTSIKFVLTRVFSLVEEMFLFWIMIDLLNINDMFSKLVVQAIVIITNYVTGKFFAFKK